jgi:hypothetical protein
MMTNFCKNTPFLFLPIDTPDCFLRLDAYFDKKIPESDEASMTKIFDYTLVSLAENICYRMGDIELYSFLINELSNSSTKIWAKNSPIRQNIFKRTILARSLIISYFSACKSLFDAGAIALNQLYRLNLGDKEQDFRKSKFINALKDKGKSDYSQFEGLVNDIVRWRDESIHRVPPPVMIVDSRVIPGSLVKGFRISLFGKMKKGSHMIGGPITLDEVIKTQLGNDDQKKKEIGFSELLDLHEEWRPKFTKFCELLCGDLKRADFSSGYIVSS